MRGAEHAGGQPGTLPTHAAEASASEAARVDPARAEAQLSPPPAAHRALEQMSPERLEAELQRVALLRGRTPADVAAALERHRRALAHPPPGVDPERASRSALADLILAWQAEAPTADPTARPQDELEAVFLTMDSALDTKERSRMLNELKNGMTDGPDARAGLRARIVEWIGLYGGAYMRAADPEDVEIEIEDETP
jgi:hypothetical protein